MMQSLLPAAAGADVPAGIIDDGEPREARGHGRDWRGLTSGDWAGVGDKVDGWVLRGWLSRVISQFGVFLAVLSFLRFSRFSDYE